MIVLDTNVLSEALKPNPSEIVAAWLGRQDAARIFTTAVTQAEILRGVGALPPGKRRGGLAAAIREMFAEQFDDRILPFDEHCAGGYAEIVSDRQRLGRPISQFDAMIASIARTRGAILATRDVNDFANCGIRVLNPWVEIGPH